MENVNSNITAPDDGQCGRGA